MLKKLETLFDVPWLYSFSDLIIKDGAEVKLNNFCDRKLKDRDSKCLNFYASQLEMGEGFSHCPYGFDCYKIILGSEHLILTSFVLKESNDKISKSLKKRQPKSRISKEKINRLSLFLKRLYYDVEAIIHENEKKMPAVLHEIRKYNRTVRQEAERLCRESSPNDIDNADKRLVNILKASQLMSQQFEALEFLANKELAKLPPNLESDLKRLFYKCSKVIGAIDRKKNVKFDFIGSSPKVLVNDKTFPVLVTSVLENAYKYSKDKSVIEIKISFENKVASVQVKNICSEVGVSETNRLFEKGYRGPTDLEGSGNGLYLVKLVADQHNAKVSVKYGSTNKGNMTFNFFLSLPVKNI